MSLLPDIMRPFGDHQPGGLEKDNVLIKVHVRYAVRSSKLALADLIIS
jgi:hypothetical protein